MHELLRQYAEEQLALALGEERVAHESHAKYFAEFMQARWTDLRGERQLTALLEIDSDLDNIRIAWDYWLDKQEASRLLEFIDPLWLYFEIRTSLRPAIQLFDAAAQKLSSNEPEVVCLRAQMRARQAWFIGVIGLPEQGLALGLESVRILREYNQDVNISSLASICVCAIYLSKWQEFREASREMVAWAEQRGDAFDQSFAALWLAYTFILDNQITTAGQMVQQALDVGKRLDNPFLWTWAEWDLGVLPMLIGDTGSAKGYYLRSVEQAQRIGYVRLYQLGYESLAAIALMEQDTEHAKQYALECLRISQRGGQTREMLASLRDLAWVDIAQGNSEQALQLLAVVLNHPASEQNSLTRPERLRDEAEKLRAQIEPQLDIQRYQAAWEAGQRRQLAEVVGQILNQGSPDLTSPTSQS